MSEPLIVVFTECGKALYVVAKGSPDMFVGGLVGAPTEAIETLNMLLHTEGALILKQSLEALTGLVCV